MNPEQALESQDDKNQLIHLMTAFAKQTLKAEDRGGVLENAGVDDLAIQTDSAPLVFANALVAALARHPVTAGAFGNHPLYRWVDHLLAEGPEQFGVVGEENVAFLQRLKDQVKIHTAAVTARRSVGMLEGASGKGFGTGFLVARRLLLTCGHVVAQPPASGVWIRFGYKINADDVSRSPGVRYRLDVGKPVAWGDGGVAPDFALLRLSDDSAAELDSLWLKRESVSTDQSVRLIHHPGGKPAVVSDPGRVCHADGAYLLHDVPTQGGSSGAPVFDIEWRVIAVHRGDSEYTIAGQTEAVPLKAILSGSVAKLLEKFEGVRL